MLDDVLIACDQAHVMDACQSFGAQAVMTSPDHASGTDRIAEAVKDYDADIIVNIQGDEPLIPPEVIDRLVVALKENQRCVMATVIKRIDDAAQISNPNVVKVVVDGQGAALYFSRQAIPFYRDHSSVDEQVYFKHIGLYAYRKDFLMRFHNLAFSHLEHAEKLEQLRVLEAGYQIQTIETQVDGIGVDTPDDLARVAQLLCGGRNE